MSTEDLVMWLRGVLDEEEVAAEQLLQQAQDIQVRLQDHKNHLGRIRPGWYLWSGVERMVAGALADIVAKRRILDLWDAMAAGVEAADGTILSGAAKIRLDAYDNTIRLIASVYADRPEYREDWKQK